MHEAQLAAKLASQGFHVDGGVLGKLTKRAVGTGCPSQLQVLPLGIAADCKHVTGEVADLLLPGTYIANYGSTEAALNQILSNVNTASGMLSHSIHTQLLTLVKPFMSPRLTFSSGSPGCTFWPVVPQGIR